MEAESYKQEMRFMWKGFYAQQPHRFLLHVDSTEVFTIEKCPHLSGPMQFKPGIAQGSAVLFFLLLTP